jgi:hypothetical protein
MGWLPAFALLAALGGILVYGWRAGSRIAEEGDKAPAFNLLAVRGGRYGLTALLERKRAVLLSFVATRPGPLSPAEPDPSRAQIVFLKSMAQQYAPKGVQVLIVDGSGARGGKPLAPGALLNLTYDWQLDDVPVLRDDKGGTASSYRVSSLPATFLIEPGGRILRRWDRFVPPAQLALALESVVGPPRFRR